MMSIMLSMHEYPVQHACLRAKCNHSLSNKSLAQSLHVISFLVAHHLETENNEIAVGGGGGGLCVQAPTMYPFHARGA